MKALILAADGFEDLTLFLPWYRLREEGVEVTLACPFLHAVTGAHGYAVSFAWSNRLASWAHTISRSGS